MLAQAVFAVLLAAVAPLAPTNPGVTVEEVVVTARRSGVPIWRVGSGDAAFVLVGGTDVAPKGLTWRSAELEAAVAGSRKVYTSWGFSFTAGDVYRLLFKRGRYLDLPKGESLDRLLSPQTRERLAGYAAARRLPADYRKLRPWWIAILMEQSLEDSTGVDDGREATSVLERAAARARKPVAPVVKFKVADLMEEAAQLRAGDEACVAAVADAVDAGPDAVRRRAEAWTRGRVTEVADSPLSIAEQSCWPESDPARAAEVRTAWRELVRRELRTPGVVVAVAPLRYLTEPGGLLDTLSADGHAIEGPSWRGG